jgi:hypothetical protein
MNEADKPSLLQLDTAQERRTFTYSNSQRYSAFYQ